MTCGGCVNSVKRVLEALPGVQSATVSLAEAAANIEYDPLAVSVADLKTAIESAGFEVSDGA